MMAWYKRARVHTLTSRFDVINIKVYTCCLNMAQSKRRKTILFRVDVVIYTNIEFVYTSAWDCCSLFFGCHTQFEYMQILLLIVRKTCDPCSLRATAYLTLTYIMCPFLRYQYY